MINWLSQGHGKQISIPMWLQTLWHHTFPFSHYTNVPVSLNLPLCPHTPSRTTQTVKMIVLPPQPLSHLYLYHLLFEDPDMHPSIMPAFIQRILVHLPYPGSWSRVRVTQMGKASSPSNCTQFRTGVKQIKKILSRKFYNHLFIPQPGGILMFWKHLQCISL